MKLVKVRFSLDCHEDGFPPLSSEILNGILVDRDVVKIDNTPFFVESIASGDLVSCSLGLDDVYDFLSLISESGNKSLSIIFINDSCKEMVYQKMKLFGCYCEFGEFDGFNMLAVSVDKAANFPEIVEYLAILEANGDLSYAELCL